MFSCDGRSLNSIILHFYYYVLSSDLGLNCPGVPHAVVVRNVEMWASKPFDSVFSFNSLPDLKIMGTLRVILVLLLLLH